MLNRIKTILASALLLALLSTQASALELNVGKAQVLRLPREAAEVMVSNPAIADVQLPSANRLYLMARAVGDANVFVFGPDGDVITSYDIHVSIDEDTLIRTLRSVLPHEEISARTVNRDVILTGQFSSTSAAETGRQVARRFVEGDANLVDLTTIKGQQQVLLRVRIMEVQKNILNELGAGVNSDGTNIGGNAVVGTLATAIGNGLTEVPFATGSLLFSAGGFGPISLAVQALERDGRAKTLAEPNLTAVSGETASFLAGGEFPIPVSQDNTGAITIQFRSFGVSLAFTPTVMNDDRIVLRLGTEVSTLSQEGQIEMNDIVIPALAVRRAETTVEMGSGGSLMIAGLLKSDITRAASGVPGVSSMPVLGELFGSDSFRANQTELLVLVTAILVEPYSSQQAELVRPAPADLGLSSDLSAVYGGGQPAQPQGGNAAPAPEAVPAPGGYIMD
jgi:pilus assembly protein CpaC